MAYINGKEILFSVKMGIGQTGFDAFWQLLEGNIVIIDSINLQDNTTLSSETITSIIEHLSDTATGKTLTLSKTAVDNAFKSNINPEGSTTRDWAMLLSTKSNWTIALL